jgi:hypothetical protein
MKRAQRDLRSRIAQLLTRHGADAAALALDFACVTLADLDLDSLSLLAFLSDLEREFGLDLAALRGLARRDCRLGELLTACRAAYARTPLNSGELPLAA